MKKPKDRDDDENPLSRPKLNGEIEFKNVTFTYPGSKEPALRVSGLKITAGEKVAVWKKWDPASQP